MYSEKPIQFSAGLSVSASDGDVAKIGSSEAQLVKVEHIFIQISSFWLTMKIY